MRIVQTLEGYGCILGVQRPDGTGLFNRRKVIALLISVLYFVMANLYLVYRREYAMCFFVCVTLLLMIIGFLIMIIKAPVLFQLLDGLEASIDRGQ